LLTYMGHQNHILTLTAVGWAAPPGPVAARADIDDPAKARGGDAFTVLLNKCELHLLWPAKKIVAFLTTLSSRRRRFSLRSSAISRSK
jgi:hypothetical protein